VAIPPPRAHPAAAEKALRLDPAVAERSDAQRVALPGPVVLPGAAAEPKARRALAAASSARLCVPLATLLRIRSPLGPALRGEARREEAASVPIEFAPASALPVRAALAALPDGWACRVSLCFAPVLAPVRRAQREKAEKRERPSLTEDAGAAVVAPRAEALTPRLEPRDPAEPRAQLRGSAPEPLPAVRRRFPLPLPPPASRSSWALPLALHPRHGRKSRAVSRLHRRRSSWSESSFP